LSRFEYFASRMVDLIAAQDLRIQNQNFTKTINIKCIRKYFGAKITPGKGPFCFRRLPQRLEMYYLL
jgi:hypothetical protein